MSILKPKASLSRKAMTLRIDADLHEQIERVRVDAARAGCIFDASDVCARALAVAVKTARAELAALNPQLRDQGGDADRISHGINSDAGADAAA